jgi:hypothetical protein
MKDTKVQENGKVRYLCCKKAFKTAREKKSRANIQRYLLWGVGGKCMKVKA